MEPAVLVTGASGFLGQRLCGFLSQRGIPVRAAHRRASTPPGLAAIRGVAPVRADLETREGAELAVRGCSSVIHAAARVSDWGSERAFMKANYEATVLLLDAAEAAGCARFVYVGTVGVHGLKGHRGTTEQGPYYGELDRYQRTKRLGERATLERNRPGFATTSLRMGYLYGPGDTTTTYRMFRAIEAGWFGWIGDGSARTSFTYVDDACGALHAALTSASAAGEAFNITDAAAVAWKDITRALFEVLGSHGRPRRMPRALAYAAAGILSAGARLAGSSRGPPLTAYRVRRATTDCVYSNEKARLLLGFRPTVSWREGFERAAAAYLSSKNS